VQRDSGNCGLILRWRFGNFTDHPVCKAFTAKGPTRMCCKHPIVAAGSSRTPSFPGHLFHCDVSDFRVPSPWDLIICRIRRLCSSRIQNKDLIVVPIPYDFQGFEPAFRYDKTASYAVGTCKLLHAFLFYPQHSTSPSFVSLRSVRILHRC
jgi:hypothetical protein